MGFIVIGRTAHMHTSPGEVVAPRYMFWSSLFLGGSVSHFRSERRLKKMGEVADLFGAVSATPFDFSGTLPGSCMGKTRASNNGIRSYESDKWSLRYRYGRPDVSDPCHRI